MIENDMCVRVTPVYDDYDGIVVALRKECVITKEEFIACYDAWIKDNYDAWIKVKEE